MGVAGVLGAALFVIYIRVINKMSFI
jgi:hypothetical protein